MSGLEKLGNGEDDLSSYLIFQAKGDQAFVQPSKSILEYRARMAQANAPKFEEPDVGAGLFVSGRGQYVESRILRPGQSLKHLPEDDLIIQRKIREMMGPGHSNEFIKYSLQNIKPAESNSVPFCKLVPAENTFEDARISEDNRLTEMTKAQNGAYHSTGAIPKNQGTRKKGKDRKKI